MTRLPPALSRWGEALAGLSPDAARAVGALLPMIDELIGRLDQRVGASGEPDGYDGTTNRGDLGRLLMDEWLLAEQIPEEFLRRAAEHELAFLRVAHRVDAPRGRVVAVVDTGPEQLGVGRLVQLAALVVLHRRAVEAGSELALVLLSAAVSGRFVAGSLGVTDGDAAEPAPAPIVAGPDALPPALTAWVSARSAKLPTPAQVAAAFAAAADDDRVWLLAGPTTRAQAPPGHRRTVSSRVARWADSGADRLAVRVGDSTAEVDVPSPSAAVAALRGEGLLRRRTDPTVTSVPTTGRGAVFRSGDARLLWRGQTDQEIFGCFVAKQTKVRRYRFQGAVLAVNSLGKRVVATVTDGQAVWIEVIGKQLAYTDRIQVALTDLDVDAGTLRQLLAMPPAPLHLQGSQILLGLRSGWWGLADQRCWETGIRAVAPSHALDNPHVIHGTGSGGARIGGHDVVGLAAGPIIGPVSAGARDAPLVAWSIDSRIWTIARGETVLHEVGLDERDRVVGLGATGQGPFLLVTSESGRIVRQVSPTKVRTWTRWAGPAHFSLHPHRPWLARTTEDRITVGDLQSGETLLEIGAS